MLQSQDPLEPNSNLDLYLPSSSPYPVADSSTNGSGAGLSLAFELQHLDGIGQGGGGGGTGHEELTRELGLEFEEEEEGGERSDRYSDEDDEDEIEEVVESYEDRPFGMKKEGVPIRTTRSVRTPPSLRRDEDVESGISEEEQNHDRDETMLNEMAESTRSYNLFLQHLDQHLSPSTAAVSIHTTTSPLSKSPTTTDETTTTSSAPFDYCDRQHELETLGHSYLSLLASSYLSRDSQTRELLEIERLLNRNERDQNWQRILSNLPPLLPSSTGTSTSSSSSSLSSSSSFSSSAAEIEAIEEENDVTLTTLTQLSNLRTLTSSLLTTLFSISETTLITSSNLSTTSRQLRGLRNQLMTTKEEMEEFHRVERIIEKENEAFVSGDNHRRHWRSNKMRELVTSTEMVLETNHVRARQFLSSSS